VTSVEKTTSLYLRKPDNVLSVFTGTNYTRLINGVAQRRKLRDLTVMDSEVKTIHGVEVFYAGICSSCEDRGYWPQCQEGCEWMEEYLKCELN
jgi:hypothetical protein